MPVEDHPVHEKTKITSDDKYGCFNREQYADAYYAPQRFAGSDGYKPVFRYEAMRIPFRMSRECITAKTGWAATDPRCQGCKWIKT